MIELKHLRTERTATYAVPDSPQRVQRVFAGIEHYYNQRWNRFLERGRVIVVGDNGAISKSYPYLME